MNALRACAATSWLGAGAGALVASVSALWWASWVVAGLTVVALFADQLSRLHR